MRNNIFVTSNLRKPIRLVIYVLLFGLMSFVFVTKVIGFIVVQRETQRVGLYYRSIGILENVTSPQFGDISEGVDLISSSTYFSYGNEPEFNSAVMEDIFNCSALANSTLMSQQLPEEYWPNVHGTDIWIVGELIAIEDIYSDNRSKSIGYGLKFHIDEVLAAYPEDASDGGSIVLLFLFDDHPAALSTIQEMQIGQRYFVHGWEDIGSIPPELARYAVRFKIIPLVDQNLWFFPIEDNEELDLETSNFAEVKNNIDILIENQHALGVVSTTDMSALPRMQEDSHFYILTEGRFLNYQDHLEGNKVIVLPECLALERDIKIGDKISLTFRPLEDTYYGRIRDGIDTVNWRNYPTYQDTFTVVGKYNHITQCASWGYIPRGSMQKGYTSSYQPQFGIGAVYSFVLGSSRFQNEFEQNYQEPLQDMGIKLTFLKSNSEEFWAAVDPILQSARTDFKLFGLLFITAVIVIIFLYITQYKKEYAILRAIGCSRNQANKQLIFSLMTISILGVIGGGIIAWEYAIEQAIYALSTIQLPSGEEITQDVNLWILLGVFFVIFLIILLVSWLAVAYVSRLTIIEMLQGRAKRETGNNNSKLGNNNRVVRLHSPSSDSQQIEGRQANPSSSSIYIKYIIQHAYRSGFRSVQVIIIVVIFIVASGWIRKTLNIGQTKIEVLYNNTEILVDILPASQLSQSEFGEKQAGDGFIYFDTIQQIMQSGFIIDSRLEADTNWIRIEQLDIEHKRDGTFPVYAYGNSKEFVNAIIEPSTILFSSEWNVDIFDQEWDKEYLQDGVPVIFPANMLDELELTIGEEISITNYLMGTYTCVIVGEYSGGRVSRENGVATQIIGTAPIMIPLETLIAMEGNSTLFTVAQFTIDPSMNRELDSIEAAMNEIINSHSAGRKELRIEVWDGQFNTVIGQMENNMSILQVLYPILVLVFCLLTLGISLLMALQRMKEMAILRVLGVSVKGVWFLLICETLCLSTIGLSIGIVLSYTLGLITDEFVMVGGFYLLSTLIGIAIGTIWITNKQPLDLLQVKE